MRYFVIDNNEIIEEKEMGDCPEFYHYENGDWLAKDKIGFLSYVLQNNSLELRQIFINKDNRRNGFGKILLNKLIDVAKENNINNIWLISSAKNEDTFGIWLNSNGFNKESSSKKWIKNI